MMRTAVSFLMLILCVACGSEPGPEQAAMFDDVDSPMVYRRAYSSLEARLLELGLVDVQSLDSTIRVELKYSTTDNFLGFDAYGDMEKAYLQPDVAKMMVDAQHILKESQPGYSLIVYDAVRPVSLQKVFWDSIKVPINERGKYVAYPGNGGSIHNYGAAVDVSIVDQTGKALDMGCPFDHFGEIAYPSMEEKLLADGTLTQTQYDNRKLLRNVMRKAGFWNIQTEWWHFVACSREVAMGKYNIVE